jgi:Xaa-Pro aminopeptidase
MNLRLEPRILIVLATVALAVGHSSAQTPLFTDALPAEEFAARRAKVFDAIGDGVAVLQGAAEYPAYVRFRQNSQFFYLTGVEVPRALVLLDGRTKSTTLFVAPRNERLERSEGPVLVPGDEAARLTGIAQVRERDAFAEALKAAATTGRTLYIPHRAESLGAATPQAAAAHAAASTKDPWDGRPSRAAQFIQKVTEAAPGAKVADLDPILDRLRLIKSPREIALVREATRLAGVAIAEAIRSARPGQHENDLEAIADYVFKQGGAQGFAYFALAAAGKNAHYPHYHGGEAELKSGDLVLFDYAPDYRYYTSDVTRMFPVSGRFSPEQKERYTVYLRMYQALMESIKPNTAPRDIIRDAVVKMDRIVAGFGFSSDVTKQAAQAFVERYRANTRNSLGHTVGMEVHDVQPPADVLLPGMIFTIEPALTIPDERVYIRLEDVILITETGYENLSGFLPMDADAIEKLMAETGRFEEQPPGRGTR